MKISRSSAALTAFFVSIAVAITGCTTDGGSPADSPMGQSSNTGGNMPKVSGVAGSAPEIAAPQGNPPAQLVTEDIFMGDGATAQPNSTLTVHYTLMAWSTGEVVESSWAGEAATFGLNQVISGWQQGIPGMKVGGRRLLVIPPDLGYGAAGGGPIGPNETLIFVVDLLAVS
jgi:peptidylprolyl isomerase